jgi:hypothetical protein
VHCHVVRQNDTFRWRPGEMEVPYHVIHAPADSIQEGLADDDERGAITGVYAYAVFLNGGISQPVVMSRSTIRKHRDYAKTDKFWGPKEGLYDRAKEGPWTPDMVKKTAIHKLYDSVPHSSEFLMEQMRVAAEVARMPVEHRPQMAPPVIDDSETPAIAAGEVADERPPAPDDNGGTDLHRAALNRLGFLFKQYGLGQQNAEDTRRAVVAGLLQLNRLPQIEHLNTDVLSAVADTLEDQFKDADNRGDKLRAYASQVADAIMKAAPGTREDA